MDYLTDRFQRGEYVKHLGGGKGHVLWSYSNKTLVRFTDTDKAEWVLTQNLENV